MKPIKFCEEGVKRAEGNCEVLRRQWSGIPNVGKSTLIPYLEGRVHKQAIDCITKGKQWIKLKGNIDS